MTTMPSPSSLTLRHQPYGEQRPYDPLPYERFPRDPSAGEPVTLGIETGRLPAAESVWCIWHEGANPNLHRAEAVDHVVGETSDLWQIQLPAFNGGEVIHYRLFGSSGESQFESEEFTFSVDRWIKVESILAVEEDGERLVVKMATGQPGLSVRLQAEPGPSDVIALRLTALHEDDQRPSSSPKKPLTFKWGITHLTLTDTPPRLGLERESDGLKLQSAAPMRVRLGADGRVRQYQLGFESPSDEAFYGFGERFNALDQRGQCLDNYVYGQYTNQGKRTYIPIPFFMSSRGYGCWLMTERQAKFDLAATDSSRWSLTGNVEEDASLEMKFFLGQPPHAIVQAFTDLTGKPQLPPPWVFGLWMSSNDWNSQAEVIRQVQQTRKHQIPASVLVIEAWSDEITFYIWNDGRYQPKPSSQAYRLGDYTFPPEGRWPDPKAMTEQLHEAGLRLVLWQNPVIKQGEPREHLDERQNQADQEYAIQQGYVIRKADGSPHRVEAHMPWFQKSLVLDFTNPQAAEWWLNQREYLITEIGVDGFKTDGGEHIWDPETQFSNGLRGTRGINIYPLVYEAAYRRFFETHRGTDHVLFSRAGYTGAQNSPCHWAGDENSTWEAFRASLRAMLNIGQCGVPFIGWDIAGFAGPIPSSELYLRAAAFSVFCPIMQYHSDVNPGQRTSRDRTPWNIQKQTGDLKVIPIFRQLANLRMNLVPYILKEARSSSRSGLPLMRALPLEFPEDPACRAFPSEYLFGEALLVAPVMEPGKDTWRVYLPREEWRDIWTGEIYSGLQTIEVPVPMDRIPVYQRKGTILPLNLGDEGTLCSPVGNSVNKWQNLDLMIFSEQDCELPLDPGNGEEIRWIWFSAVGETGEFILNLPALEAEVHVSLPGIQAKQVLCDGKPLPQDPQARADIPINAWSFSAEKKQTEIALPSSRLPRKVTLRVRD
jgi:alpha-glucosidase (family GH31 glycosyl hydrolase)